MAIGIKIEPRLSQSLVMTPQLQQAIKLLQLNQIELVNLVEQEMQENPVLERVEGEEDTQAERDDATPDYQSGADAEDGADTPPEAGSDEPRDLAESMAEAEFAGEASATSEAGEATEAATESPSDADKIADIEWENYLESNSQTLPDSRVSSGDDEQRNTLEATLTRRPNLAEHLEWQIGVSDFDDLEIEIADWIIGNLDDRGYLCSSVEEIARQAGVGEEAVERTLVKVHKLDPAGVGARDLRECLLLQLKPLKIEDPLVIRIIDEHLDLLQKRDFRGLSRVLGVPTEEIGLAARVIATMEPRPARGFGGEDPVYITPDIYVTKYEGDFHISLNEDGLPKLKVSNLYKDILTKGETPIENRKDTREYVSEKMKAATWLIKSILQRQRTIEKVMRSIISFQREFFEKGVAYLKPLNLRDVADDIEMHESTVSRVTTNKYVHTPQGIFELKYFFNASINTVGGDAVASESVKDKIRKLIASEDPAKPLSDQRIVEMLKVKDIDIARRTVTKYRVAMNILPSTKRRQV